jgi:hypothetical protein
MTAKRLLRQFLNERGPRSYATAWRQTTPGLDPGYHPARAEQGPTSADAGADETVLSGAAQGGTPS